jgi:uncharacterized protein YgiM (DUF1202 family)
MMTGARAANAEEPPAASGDGPPAIGAATADRQRRQRPKREREVVVEDPYLDLHVGPGRGYPVFYIAERGEHVAVLKRRTDWFKVRVPRGEEGWVSLEQLERTLGLDGKHFEVPGFELSDYTHRRWEVGAMYGDFGGANLIAAYGEFSLNENIAIEAWASQALGRFSDSKLLSLDVVETFYPEKRFSPYFVLGGGIVTTEPKATLVATTDRTDRAAHAGLGLRAYLTRRFVFRAEYKDYVIFTGRNDNEEIREWIAGLSFFL